MKLPNCLMWGWSMLLFCSISSCAHHNSKPPFRLVNGDEKYLAIKIIDSLMLDVSIGSSNDFLPLSLSPSKRKLLIANTLGTKGFYIVDLLNKNTNFYDLKGYKSLNINKTGVNNIGLVSDTVVSIFYKGRLSLLDYKNKNIFSQTVLPKGYFSSYTKKVIVDITQDDTLYISQLYSPKKGKYNYDTDGFYDICPLSIYSTNKNKFEYIYLPKFSKFRTRNLGQPIVNFTQSADTIFFSASPESKVYSFVFNPKNLKIGALKSYAFRYSTGDTILSLQKSNLIKDVLRTSVKNPYQTGIVKFKNNILLSYSNGLSETEYKLLFSNKFTEEQRANYLLNKRRYYTEILNLSKKKDFGKLLLNLNMEALALQLTDSTYAVKPRSVFYHNDTIVPIYIVKLKMQYE